MFEYIDVTNDHSAARRSGISEGSVAKAEALGFSDVGFIAAIVKGSTSHMLVSRVMLYLADNTTLLALTRTKGRDTISLKTLFEDGYVVSTEERPKGISGKLVSRAIKVSERHHYDLVTFPTNDLGQLVELHKARVAERSAKSGATVVAGDLRTYIAMRIRYREIANPRFEAQQKFSTRFSWAVFVLVAILSIFGLAVLGIRGSSAVGAGVVGFLFAAVCGTSAFPIALVLFAPLVVKDAEAPPPRPAAELLTLTEDVRAGRIPILEDDDSGSRDSMSDSSARDEDNDDDNDRRIAALRTRSARLVLPADALVRLRRRDLVVSIASSLLLPIAGFALMPILGSVGPTAALGSVASVDAAILFIMKRSRVDLLRDRFLPELVEAEGPTESLSPSWLRWISLAIGVLALASARRAIAKGIEPAEGWLLAEWGVLTGLFIFASWRSIRRRHARFDANAQS